MSARQAMVSACCGAPMFPTMSKGGRGCTECMSLTRPVTAAEYAAAVSAQASRRGEGANGRAQDDLALRVTERDP